MLSRLKLQPTKREQVSPYGDKLRTSSGLRVVGVKGLMEAGKLARLLYGRGKRSR